MRLDNKIAIITGAAGGLDRLSPCALPRRGH